MRADSRTSDGRRGKDQAYLYRNVQWFRSGLVFKAHQLVYHSTLGLRVIKLKRRGLATVEQERCPPRQTSNVENASK